jgi:quinoprotein glucose dehydrogenase
MMVTPEMLLHTAIGDDGQTPFIFAINKQTGERMSMIESPGLGMYGMMTYQHDGRQRIVLQTAGQLVAYSLPSDKD